MQPLPDLPLLDVCAAPGSPAPVAREAERFAPDDARADAHLAELGYAVVRAVADEAEVARALELLWSHLEALGTGIDRRSPETWDDARWIGDPTTGILPDCGVPQSELLWYCRALPPV